MAGISSFGGNSIRMIEKSLDYLWQKQRVTSNNIANIDTPGYKSKYVTFEEDFQSRLKAALSTGDRGKVSSAIKSTAPRIHEDKSASARLDGNNVNADVQMVEMTRTALQYQYALSSVNSDISRLRTAIKGQ